MDLDGSRLEVADDDPKLINLNLVAALNRLGFLDESATDLKLRVDAEADGEIFADGDLGQGHPADEIIADVHDGLAGKKHRIARVDQVGQSVNPRR